MILAPHATLTDLNPPSDLATAARDRLRQSPYRAMRSVICEYHHGTLFLRGRLTSYYLKQMAQETVGRLAGIVRVVNRIEVI